MTTETASDFASEARPAPVEKSSRSGIFALTTFLRTPSLARSVVVLLSGALLLLLVVNFSTYVLIQRTAGLNAEIDATWQMRRSARNMILNVEGVLMDAGFPEFHVKKELYWPKGKPSAALAG